MEFLLFIGGVGFLLYDMKVAKACFKVKIEWIERYNYKFPHKVECKETVKTPKVLSEKIRSRGKEYNRSISSSADYINMNNIRFEGLIKTDSTQNLKSL